MFKEIFLIIIMFFLIVYFFIETKESWQMIMNQLEKLIQELEKEKNTNERKNK